MWLCMRLCMRLCVNNRTADEAVYEQHDCAWGHVWTAMLCMWNKWKFKGKMERCNGIMMTKKEQRKKIVTVSLSPSTAVPGGRLWACAPQESLPDTVNISATYSPSRQDLIHNLLSWLSEIEFSVNALSQTVDLELLCLDTPLFINSSSFPLNHLFLECHHLNADLEKVKSKVASVTTTKTAIKVQLDAISKKLQIDLEGKMGEVAVEQDRTHRGETFNW